MNSEYRTRKSPVEYAYDAGFAAGIVAERAARDAKWRASLRCFVTKNQCGTDTWMIGRPCQCPNCKLFLEAWNSNPTPFWPPSDRKP